MRRIASLLLPALAAGTLLLSSACNSKKTELQDIHLGSNQLSAFSISSSEKKVASALERVQFSIRNSTEGQITNPEPLPYGQALDKVRLRITAAAAAAQVEVALAGAEGLGEALLGIAAVALQVTAVAGHRPGGGVQLVAQVVLEALEEVGLGTHWRGWGQG